MNQLKVLIILCVVLLISACYAWFATPHQQKVDVKISTQNIESELPVSRSIDAYALNFTNSEAETYTKPKRDLFRPLYQPKVEPRISSPKKKLVRHATPALVKPVTVVIAPTPPVVVSPPISKPILPPIVERIPQLKVVGFLQNGLVPTAFLSSKGGELYLVKEGDTFADTLFVEKLDAEKIIIRHRLSSIKKTISIEE